MNRRRSDGTTINSCFLSRIYKSIYITRSNQHSNADSISLLRNLIVFLPGRYDDSEFISEAYWISSTIMLSHNQSKTSTEEIIPPPYYLSILKWIAVLQNIELTCEVYASTKFKKKSNRWLIIILLEALKAFLRLKLLIKTNGNMLVYHSFHVPTKDVQEFTQKARVASNSSRFIEGSRKTLQDQIIEQNELKIKEEEEESTLLSMLPPCSPPDYPTKVIGELLFIFRPLAYCVAHWKYGKKSWKPWILSLVMEGASKFFSEFGSNKEYLSDLESIELKRRRGLFIYYLLRNPFYDKFIGCSERDNKREVDSLIMFREREREKMKKDEPALLQLSVGAASGVLADSIMHPIDTIRARLQIEKVGQQQYKGTIDAFQSIIRKEGWRCLYKGFPIVVTATIPAHALYFYGYEYSKKELAKVPSIGNGIINHFTSGLVADVAGAMIWTPMDVIKQRLQVQKAQVAAGTTFYRGSFHAVNVIYREEGIRGFYRGFLPSLATFGPLVGIYFATYEQTKRWMATSITKKPDQVLPLPLLLGAGFFAGTVAAAVTCPLDVIKTRIQVARANESTYKGIIDGFKRILKEEGPRAFVKGMGARILWIAPGNAITIASYQMVNGY
ncbi:mitochondrial substrate carrier family protein [Cavenderia fasciculata]|uniref:Mitochondrial substrate carrier family protein n=1 Tax=Cavenderia fasciculata TaxID=261658 RepID=F4PSS6_CACFS|nr:mitochondrial substrate carrier family protein [Cavenderia fasciculata]EGG21554.1 mitochondrial substrate carrier family protein [Cavenderia fasciculata]|eukprot:XP_004359404.1 mitochondrial substrate carrier family protein [Cavenderia fasciculata]